MIYPLRQVTFVKLRGKRNRRGAPLCPVMIVDKTACSLKRIG